VTIIVKAFAILTQTNAFALCLPICPPLPLLTYFFSTHNVVDLVWKRLRITVRVTVLESSDGSSSCGSGYTAVARGSAVPMQSMNGVGGQGERDFALLINMTRRDERSRSRSRSRSLFIRDPARNFWPRERHESESRQQTPQQ